MSLTVWEYEFDLKRISEIHDEKNCINKTKIRPEKKIVKKAELK